MFSEIRERVRLPSGRLNLPAAIERVGELSVAGWIGKAADSEDPERLSAEREAMACIDEGQAVANYFEPPPEPPAASEAVCATCGKPATLVSAGRHYCAQHQEILPIPKAVRDRIAKQRVTIAGDINAGSTAEPCEDDHETGPLIDPAAPFRWDQAHAALRDKVLAGELSARLREPSGKVVSLTADQWCAEGFPAPDEARAQLRSRGHVPMDVIFDAAELDRAFPVSGTAEKTGAAQNRPAAPGPSEQFVSSRSPYSTEQIQTEVDDYLKANGVIDDGLKRTNKPRILNKTIVADVQEILPGCGRDHIIKAANRRQPAPGKGRPKNSRE